MKTLKKILKFFIRLLVVWFVDTISLLVTAWLLPGVNLSAVGDTPAFVVATAAAFVLGIVNFFIRPLILLVAMPLGWMVLFLVGFLINGVVLWVTAALMPGLEVTNFWYAFLGGLILSLINTILTTLLAIDDDDSFYENLIQRRALRMSGEIDQGEGQGIVMLEVDGLSYPRIKKAIADGYMPTLKSMIDEEGYQLSRAEAGVPPTTPACQAGILQGNNTNIPAFRWLDKKTGRILAGGGAAAEIEPILSDGNGLLRGGSSIGNMFSGDAAKSILTFSKIKAGTPEDKKQRARDFYLLMRNPYFFMRVLVLYFADIALEVWQGWQQKRKNVLPRLNRLHNGYPFLRAATNVFLRDIGTYFTMLDIIRGVPAIYTLYAGYDEVAHHSGPYTHDADLTLRQFDKQVARIKKVIETKATRPYEMLLLSDHGQSFGPTFEQRYGISILEFIQQQLPQDVRVAGTGGGDDGTIGVSAMMGELQNVQESEQGGRMGRAVLHQTQRAFQRNLDQQVSMQEVKPAKVTFSYGGNGGLVYFDLYPRKITLNELNAAYPGMVDKVVQHEGIGFVIAYEDDYTPVAFGKKGARNLATGDVVGEDPLLPYGDVDLRAWQLRRLAEFENSGDLILNSTLYPDGTVAALEELIGNHGGLGGEQTDAYLFHPSDMEIPEMRGSFEFKALLDSRRGLPGGLVKPARATEPQVNPWALSNLLKGLGMVGTWIGHAARSLILDVENYREIARDAFMTAPALLIVVLMSILRMFNQSGGFSWLGVVIYLAAWLLAMILMQLAARILRGKAEFHQTLRVAGFAQTAFIFELLAFLPVIGPLARILATTLNLVGVWIGIATAHELKGWRSILLPVIYLVVFVVGAIFIVAVISGVQFTLNSLLADVGWTPYP